MQLMVANVVRELTALPDISKANVDLAAIADQTAFVEYYRWVESPLLPPGLTDIIASAIVCLCVCVCVCVCVCLK